jgi:hypothetical protein
MSWLKRCGMFWIHSEVKGMLCTFIMQQPVVDWCSEQCIEWLLFFVNSVS